MYDLFYSDTSVNLEWMNYMKFRVKGLMMQADVYPDHLQLCIQSVQLHKVFFVDDLTSRFQPPIIQLPLLHPAGHTCSKHTTDFKHTSSVDMQNSGSVNCWRWAWLWSVTLQSAVFLHLIFFLRLTIDCKLAVCVKNQLLYVVLFGLFQRFAGCLVHTETHIDISHMAAAINTLLYLCPYWKYLHLRL